jgi:hypothetical protein
VVFNDNFIREKPRILGGEHTQEKRKEKERNWGRKSTGSIGVES